MLSFNKYGTLLFVISLAVITAAERGTVSLREVGNITTRDVFDHTESPHFAKRGLYGLKRRNDKLHLSVTLEKTPYDQWVAHLSIGTPPQRFTAIVDTGTLSTTVPLSEREGGYKPDESSTGSRHPEKKEFYKDNVIVEGMTSLGKKSITASDLFVWGANMGWHSGVLGLAHSSGKKDEPTFIQAITSSLTLPVFALYLGQDKPKLYLGGGNPVLMSGEIEYYTILDHNYWALEKTRVYLNSGEKAVVFEVKVMISSGAPFIYGPPADVEQIYKHIPESKLQTINGQFKYLIPCDKMPTISFSWNGGRTKWEVSSQMFNVDKTRNRDGKCIGALIPGDSKVRPGSWTLGGLFLRNFYTEFHLNPRRIMFAKLKQR